MKSILLKSALRATTGSYDTVRAFRTTYLPLRVDRVMALFASSRRDLDAHKTIFFEGYECRMARSQTSSIYEIYFHAGSDARASLDIACHAV